MSEAIAFDSHRFVKNLTTGGFTEEQAETLAREQVHLLAAHLATKADIAAVRADGEQVRANVERLEGNVERLEGNVETLAGNLEQVRANVERLEGNLEQVRASLEIKIQESKVDLLKWMMTAMIAQGALVVTLVKLL